MLKFVIDPNKIFDSDLKFERVIYSKFELKRLFGPFEFEDPEFDEEEEDEEA